MRVLWRGGPLDGAEDRSEKLLPLQNLWFGPDPTDPDRKVVVYGLYTYGGEREYRFDQELTNMANRRIEEILSLSSEVADADDTGGQSDGTGSDRGDPGEDRPGGGTARERDA